MFEVIDITSDEMYFTLAVFTDLKTAKEELEKRIKPDFSITDSAEYDNYEKIQIRERAIGWGDNYKIAYEIERFQKYRDDDDQYVWTTHILKSISIETPPPPPPPKMREIEEGVRVK